MNKLFKKKNAKEEIKQNKSKRISIRLKPAHVMVLIVIMFVPIIISLILIKSSSWNSAEITSMVYMTVYEDKEYILFDQSDYYIALPIERLSTHSTENKVFMKSIENEYTYLSKENLLVRSIEIDKIDKSRNDDSVFIEFTKKINTKNDECNL